MGVWKRGQQVPGRDRPVASLRAPGWELGQEVSGLRGLLLLRRRRPMGMWPSAPFPGWVDPPHYRAREQGPRIQDW